MIDLSYIILDMFNLKKEKVMTDTKVNDAIIFILDTMLVKHGELIERKGQLDGVAKGE